LSSNKPKLPSNTPWAFMFYHAMWTCAWHSLTSSLLFLTNTSVIYAVTSKWNIRFRYK
jgi:hypothetical protein